MSVMNQSQLEQIVALVTQEVMAAMGGQRPCGQSPETEGYSKMLVIGEAKEILPEELCRDTVLFDLKDYEAHKNILRYDRVLIASLTMAQMADIALGRAACDEATCAVLNALLNGVEVYMMESALPHRKFAGKGSTALYNLLESYARTLQVFGVKNIRKQIKQELPEAKPPKFQAPAIVVPKGSGKPNPNQLITEAEALQLVKEGVVELPAGAIITPSARDVFAKAGVEIRREGAR